MRLLSDECTLRVVRKQVGGCVPSNSHNTFGTKSMRITSCFVLSLGILAANVSDAAIVNLSRAVHAGSGDQSLVSSGFGGSYGFLRSFSDSVTMTVDTLADV